MPGPCFPAEGGFAVLPSLLDQCCLLFHHLGLLCGIAEAAERLLPHLGMGGGQIPQGVQE